MHHIFNDLLIYVIGLGSFLQKDSNKSSERTGMSVGFPGDFKKAMPILGVSKPQDIKHDISQRKMQKILNGNIVTNILPIQYSYMVNCI